MRTIISLFAALSACFTVVTAQQYAGQVITGNFTLPNITGGEVAYWNIDDGRSNNLTVINWASLDSNGNRPDPAKIKRAVYIMEGLNRDPASYAMWVISALNTVSQYNPDISPDSVMVVGPLFNNKHDRGLVFPWNETAEPYSHRSTSNLMVWDGSKYAAGANNEYPWYSRHTSSYDVLDQMIQYADNKAMFPNMNQIVVAGHSLGAQMVQRYAAVSQLQTISPVSYWVANADTFAWFATDRPYQNLTVGCPSYDNWRQGFSNYTEYPMTYGKHLVAQGRDQVYANFQNKAIAYAHGLRDHGNQDKKCAAMTTGSNRAQRFSNYLTRFPPTCPDPKGHSCDTVDYMNIGHNGQAMIQSPGGVARLLIDNFYGDGLRAPDMGYPRLQPNDDPYPNPLYLNNGTQVVPTFETVATSAKKKRSAKYGGHVGATAHEAPHAAAAKEGGCHGALPIWF